MKTLLALIFLAPACLAQKTLQLTFTPAVNPGWVACAAGTYCLTGYTLYEMTSGAPVAVAAVPETNTSLSLLPLPSIGVHVYHLVQDGLDGTGSAVQSTGSPNIVVNCWENQEKNGRGCAVGVSW